MGEESCTERIETNGGFNSVRGYIVSRDQISQVWNVLDFGAKMPLGQTSGYISGIYPKIN